MVLLRQRRLKHSLLPLQQPPHRLFSLLDLLSVIGFLVTFRSVQTVQRKSFRLGHNLVDFLIVPVLICTGGQIAFFAPIFRHTLVVPVERVLSSV